MYRMRRIAMLQVPARAASLTVAVMDDMNLRGKGCHEFQVSLEEVQSFNYFGLSGCNKKVFLRDQLVGLKDRLRSLAPWRQHRRTLYTSYNVIGAV